MQGKRPIPAHLAVYAFVIVIWVLERTKLAYDARWPTPQRLERITVT